MVYCPSEWRHFMEKNHVKRRALAAAFPRTLPILTGFGFLGIAYGIYMRTSGFHFLYPTLTSMIVFGGSLEFVLVSMLMSAFAPLQTFLLALMIQARHLFYGVAMLEKYTGLGWKKGYLIFGLCDETFSVNCSADIPRDVDKGWFVFFVTLLNQSYWVIACTLGGVLGSTLLAVLFAFEGWTNVGAIAGEMKNPGRDMPLAIVGGVSIIMAVYFVINMAYLWVMPAEELMLLESPASAVAMKIFGPTGGLLIKVGIIISVIGAANGFLMSGSRVAYQLAAENTLPASGALAKLNGNSVPANSILLIGVIACIYSLSGQFDMLTNLAVFSCWIFYTLTFASVIKFRKIRPDAKRLYRVPLYPVVPLLAIVSGLYVVVSQLFLSGTEATLLSLGSIVLTLIGLPVYMAVKKKQGK